MLFFQAFPIFHGKEGCFLLISQIASGLGDLFFNRGLLGLRFYIYSARRFLGARAGSCAGLFNQHEYFLGILTARVRATNRNFVIPETLSCGPTLTAIGTADNRDVTADIYDLGIKRVNCNGSQVIFEVNILDFPIGRKIL